METDFIQQFKSFINSRALVSPSDKILLAVSGGADSVVMTHLFKQLNYSIAIAHVNFRLRGDESDGDEAFVRNLAKQFGIPVFVKTIDTHHFARLNHLSIQVAAREIRYAFFEEICQEQGFNRVALAHHLDDQAETFFINLIRRAGLKGLGGMPLKRGLFFRPLFFAHRADIELYAKDQNINYRNDSSNATSHYLRNSIRHNLLPAIEENLPGFTNALITSMDHLTEADRLIYLVVEEKRRMLFSRMVEETRISVEAIKKLQPLKTWLYYLLAEFGFNAEVLQSIADTLRHSESGKIFLSSAYKLVVDRFEVIVVPLSRKLSIDPLLIEKECTEIQFPLHLRFELLDYSQSVNLKVPNNTALFDADQLHFPLQLRLWQPGDRFVPFGMKGSKLVSDFLIDQKVNLIDKEKVFVLLSGERIIWVVGHRAGNHASVIEDTHKVLRVSNDLF